MNKTIEDCTDEELQAEMVRRRTANAKMPTRAWEDLLSAAQQRDTEQVFGTYLKHVSENEERVAAECPRCGATTPVRGRKQRTIQTLAGKHSFTRNYHYCRDCRKGFYPLDLALGLPERGNLSPTMEKLVLDLGIHDPFCHGAARFALHHGFKISDNMVRGVIERVGELWAGRTPEERCEALALEKTHESVLIVEPDGSMLRTRIGPENQSENGEKRPWRDAKLGLVYRHEHLVQKDGEGRNLILESSYVASLKDFDGFKVELKALLTAHGVDGQNKASASKVVFIADGAPCNWTVQEYVCPHATQILDFYHAMEHLSTAANTAFGIGSKEAESWRKNGKQRLLHNSPDNVLRWLEYHCTKTKAVATRAALETLRSYFTTNKHRMHYADFRARGLPIGSGAIESGHVRVFQKRMKGSGMSWDLQRAKCLAKLRAAALTVGPERFYEQIRLAA